MIISLINSSCKRDDVIIPTGDLYVSVGCAGYLIDSVELILYRSESDRDNDIIYESAYEKGTGIMFHDLPSQEYIIVVKGVYGGKSVIFNESVFVKAFELVYKFINCGCFYNGDLEIFAIYPSGAYMGGAQVKLYLSESDRANDYIYQSAVTPNFKPSENGAMFYDLDPQTYYIKAEFEWNDGSGTVTYTGLAEEYVPRCQSKEVYVECYK